MKLTRTSPNQMPFILLIVVGILVLLAMLGSQYPVGATGPLSAFESAHDLEDELTVNIYIKGQSGNIYVNTSPIDMIVEFSDPVENFELEDITVQNGLRKGPLVAKANGQIYEFQIASAKDATIRVIVEAGVANDKKDPDKTNEEGQALVIFDATGPIVEELSASVSLQPPPYDTFSVKAVFSEQIKDIDVAKIKVTDGVMSSFAGEDGDSMVTFDVTLDQPDGTAKVKINDEFATDLAGNPSFASEQLTLTPIKSIVVMPSIMARFPYVGQLEYVAEDSRQEGITTFVSENWVDLTSIDFGNNPPDKVKIAEDNGWTDFAPTLRLPIPLADGPGAYNVVVLFRREYGESHHDFSADLELFYLPDGDFEDDELDASWVTVEDDLPSSVEDGQLRLGYLHSEIDFCDGVPLGAASKEITLSIPGQAAYHLRVEGMIHTYDQIPVEYPHLYDGFEIYGQGMGEKELLLRKGNTKPSLSCDKERIVPVDETIALGQFTAGKTQPIDLKLSFENWSRFDNFYNTYTEIEKIWVEK